MDTSWTPQQAYNWRDLGGLPTTRGGRVKVGRLFRSDTLQELSDSDAHRLANEVGLQTVIDLRLEGEVVREGRGSLENHSEVRHVNAPLVSVDLSVPGTAVPLITPDMLVPHYLGFLTVSSDSFATIAEVLASEGLPAVVHCAAGKDRTGVVIAVILDAIKVEREAIVADYVRSRETYPQVHARLVRLESYGKYLDKQPPGVQDSAPETMSGFLDGLHSEYGSGDEYLRSIGVSKDTLEALRSSLVTD
jgi:protein tyrosine/serine phosphatase